VSSDFKDLIIKEFERNDLLYNNFLGDVLEDYIELLISENKKYNLTSITAPVDIVNKHFIDSILGFEKFLESQTYKESFFIMDVGSGAGFPGIPILLYDQICKSKKLISKIDLLDANRKKTDFLNLMKQRIKKRIGKDLIQIHNSRLEALYLNNQIPDLYLSRATGKISNVLNFLEKFLKNNNEYVPLNGEVCLLYYGGPETKVLPEKKGKQFEAKNNVCYILHREARKVYKYQFSSNNYSRKSVLYVITTLIFPFPDSVPNEDIRP